MYLLHKGDLEVQAGAGDGSGAAEGDHHGVFLLVDGVKGIEAQHRHYCQHYNGQQAAAGFDSQLFAAGGFHIDGVSRRSGPGDLVEKGHGLFLLGFVQSPSALCQPGAVRLWCGGRGLPRLGMDTVYRNFTVFTKAVLGAF